MAGQFVTDQGKTPASATLSGDTPSPDDVVPPPDMTGEPVSGTTSGSDWTWPRRPGMKRINLALQGGGSHGAFTWGVLDRLLEEPQLSIEAISGTSAGAVNAVVMAEGLRRGGPARARDHLSRFWEAVSFSASLSPLQRTLLDAFITNWSLDANPMLAMFEMMSRIVSPYQFNPLNLNPLKELVEDQVDFREVQNCACTELYISATNVHTGRVKVFTGKEITAEAVMASACLPYIFQ